ncbi:MAG: hypothetical protein ACJ72C_02815, partial [Nitrososphaeraceae archaeon]
SLVSLLLFFLAGLCEIGGGYLELFTIKRRRIRRHVFTICQYS